MSAQRRKPTPPTPANWWDNIERPGRKIITGVAILTALGYAFGWFKPIVDSRLPTASQMDVESVKKDLEDHAQALKKGIDATLDVAKAANTAAQQSIQQTNDLHLDRLIAQKNELEDLVKKAPMDAALRAALTRTELEIAKATATPSPATIP